MKNVIRYLIFFFIIYKKLYTFYLNRDQYFDYEKLRKFLRLKRVVVDYNLLIFYKFINIIKIMNKILENVIYKIEEKN